MVAEQAIKEKMSDIKTNENPNNSHSEIKLMEFMTLMKTITVMRERFMADMEEIRE